VNVFNPLSVTSWKYWYCEIKPKGKYILSMEGDDNVTEDSDLHLNVILKQRLGQSYFQTRHQYSQ